MRWSLTAFVSEFLRFFCRTCHFLLIQSLLYFALIPYQMPFTFQAFSDSSLNVSPVITDNEPLQDTLLLQSFVLNNSSIKRAVPSIISSSFPSLIKSHHQGSFLSFSLFHLPVNDLMFHGHHLLSFDQMLIHALFPCFCRLHLFCVASSLCVPK